jgi:hypothetical protein
VADTTADEVRDAAALTAAGGVASATTDGQTAVTIDPVKQLDVADRLQARDALAGANRRGGAKSAWNKTRPAVAVPTRHRHGGC